MHLAEGVLGPGVLIGGAVIAVGGLAVGLRMLKTRDVPRVGVMAAALFVASLIHIPIGVGSVHLILNGLAGLLLGWAAFPAFFAALLLQAILFQFGGLTTLGVNTVVLAAPATVVGLLFGRLALRPGAWSLAAPFMAGAGAVAMSGGAGAAALYLSGKAVFFELAGAILLAHVPLMAIEGVFCVLCVSFLRKVTPQLLDKPSGCTDAPSAVSLTN